MSSFQHGFTFYTGDNNVTTLREFPIPNTEDVLKTHLFRIPLVGTGLLQSCAVCIDPPEGNDLPDVPILFLLDNLRPIEEFPTAELAIASSIQVLQRFKQMPFPLPYVTGRLMFLHTPISPGMVYASQPTMETEGGLYVLFRSDYDKPLPIQAFIRYSSFGS
jgi:hypothetical protein